MDTKLSEQRNLFDLIESWEVNNIQLALQLIKKNKPLRKAATDRYMPLIEFIEAKSLQALKTLVKKINNTKFYKKNWQPEPAQQAVLKTLPIEHIQLNNKGLEQFPEWICYLGRLKSLDLSNGQGWRLKNKNKIERLPTAIEELTKLTVLNLSRVDLASVPSELGNLQQLSVLDLHYNKLQSLPHSFAQLTELTYLDLFINQLQEVPGLTQFTKLTYLQLGANNLQVIPDDIGHLEKLEILSVAANDAICKIPASIGQLKKLRDLDIYSLKNLKGQVPESLTKLTQLQKFRFDSTGFKTVPLWLGTFNNLEILRCDYYKDGEKYWFEKSYRGEVQAFIDEYCRS